MSINVKPINEVPEIETLSDGDKLLVNNNGAAKQIDASKVGGSGGGTIIYCNPVTMDGETTLIMSGHKDIERTEEKRYSFSEFSALLTSSVIALSILSLDGEMEVYVTPMMINLDTEFNTAQILALSGSQVSTIVLLFSDSSLD